MEREVKFQFVIDGNKLSRGYTIDEIFEIDEEKIRENMEVCTCSLNEAINHCECDPLFADSKITGKRQYTGITTNFGKDLYEGDIVFRKSTGTTGEVIFREGKFIIKWKPIAGYVMFDSDIETAHDDEIKGNIYESPDLLK